MLRRVTYLSTASRFFDRTGRDDLDRVVEQCLRNNEKTGVTGILLFVDGAFMQVIEGEQEAIERLMAALRADPRHDGILVIEDKRATSRLFPDWSMEARRTRYLPSHGTDGETFRQAVERISREEGEGLLSVFLGTFFDNAERLRID